MAHLENHLIRGNRVTNCNTAKGSFRLAACGCESAADCSKDIYFWRQTVAFLQGDRKFPISALTQPTADARGKSSNVNEP